MGGTRDAEPARVTVGDLEAFLRDHGVPPNAEVHIQAAQPGGARAACFHVGGFTVTWDAFARVLVLVAGAQVGR